ncbi:hypothetical protein ACW9H0_29035, partial [Pseudomonas monsensis]
AAPFNRDGGFLVSSQHTQESRRKSGGFLQKSGSGQRQRSFAFEDMPESNLSGNSCQMILKPHH